MSESTEPYTKNGVLVKSTRTSIEEVENFPYKFIAIAAIPVGERYVKEIRYCRKTELSVWYNNVFCIKHSTMLNDDNLSSEEKNILMCRYTAEAFIESQEISTVELSTFLQLLNNKRQRGETKMQTNHQNKSQANLDSQTAPYTRYGVEVKTAIITDRSGTYSLDKEIVEKPDSEAFVTLTAIYFQQFDCSRIWYCKKVELEIWYRHHASKQGLEKVAVPDGGDWWEAYAPICEYTEKTFTDYEGTWTQDLANFFKEMETTTQMTNEETVVFKSPREILLKIFEAGTDLKEALCGDTWAGIEIDGREAFAQLNQYDDDTPTIYDLCAYPVRENNEVDYQDFSLGMASVPEDFIKAIYKQYLSSRQEGRVENTDEVKIDSNTDKFILVQKEFYDRLNKIGLIPNTVNQHNVGASNYAEHLIQPWHIFNAHPHLNYQECDLIKRLLRSKPGERKLDLEKCQHILAELIRQEDFK